MTQYAIIVSIPKWVPNVYGPFASKKDALTKFEKLINESFQNELTLYKNDVKLIHKGTSSFAIKRRDRIAIRFFLTELNPVEELAV